MAEKKTTAGPKNILDLLTATPEAQRTFDALKLSPEAQKLQSVLDEAARLERRDALENLSHELHAEQIRKEDDRLQLAMEREAFDRIERDEMARLSARAKWDASQHAAHPVPAAAPPAPAAADGAEQRQQRRWQMCIDAGLKMPQDTYAHFPRGIKEIAKTERITRQALAQDLSAYRERLFGR